MRTILQVKELVTRFHTFDGIVHALNGVSFELQEGETLAIVGESGSGKSVTMMSLLGLLPSPPAKIEGGQALFYDDADNGQPIDLLKLPKSEMRHIRGGKIGMIFQDPMTSLNPVMRVGEQISESLSEHLGLSDDAARQEAIALLQHVGISGAKERHRNYPHQFSGGMRQRVMIAMAIACKPNILIADEPTTALDVTIQAQIVDLTKQLQEELGIAVIWITHDLGVVAGIADRVLVMYAGQVVEQGPVDEVYENAQHPYTIGLLNALPRLAAERTRLVSIEGSPPDLLSTPQHCQFAWRCPYAFERCWQEIPPAITVGKQHFARCFYDVKEGRARNG